MQKRMHKIPQQNQGKILLPNAGGFIAAENGRKQGAETGDSPGRGGMLLGIGGVVGDLSFRISVFVYVD